MKQKTSLFLLMILWTVLPGLKAQEKQQQPAAPAQFEISPAAGKIKVDGVLDEEAWKNCRVIKLPTEWTPGENTPAPVDTDCLVTYDRANIYIAFRCHDPEPQKIRAHLMDRDLMDTFIQDDHVSFWFDTFNDQRRAFQFRVNPLGVQADAVFSEQDGFEDFSWDAIWSSAARITATGYNVEVAVPFHQLRFARSAQELTWGFSAERSWPRSSRHRMESHPRDRNSNCLLCQFNKIRGLVGISPGNNLEFDPTLTVQRSDSREDFPDRRPGGREDQGRTRAHGQVGRHPQPDPQRHHQPRLLADRGRRRPARRQHALCPVLSGKKALLPGRGRFLPYPLRGGIHPHRGRPALGRQADRQGRPQRHGLFRGPGPRQQPDHPLQPGFGIHRA